ncbi:MAG: DUF3768 domain-containing protein [Rhodospirillaceae bacterium]
MKENDHATKIRTLNDHFRRTGRGGRIMLTQGIQALGQKAVAEIIAKVRAFDQFNEGNDPYQEHDFGKIIHGHDVVFFKISYYDRAMEFHSPDPANPAVTTRVMTVMTAEEY